MESPGHSCELHVPLGVPRSQSLSWARSEVGLEHVLAEDGCTRPPRLSTVGGPREGILACSHTHRAGLRSDLHVPRVSHGCRFWPHAGVALRMALCLAWYMERITSSFRSSSLESTFRTECNLCPHPEKGGPAFASCSAAAVTGASMQPVHVRSACVSGSLGGEESGFPSVTRKAFQVPDLSPPREVCPWSLG